ncbi:MAG: TetR family transcriptional regulator C-terminal domain-containing protein, partial [Caulobacterales bacterium]
VARRVLARRGNDDHTSIYADVIAEAARDKLLARKLADIDTASVSRLAAVLEAAQKRHEIDERLDTLAAARTLIATLEGIGLRYVMKPHEETCEACDMEISDFRALAERYLGSSL